MKPELVEAEKNDEEQTAPQAKKNDEVAAAQAELEKTSKAYKAARDALAKSKEVLVNTAYEAMKEAAPDEWTALEAAWSALDSAVEYAVEERAPAGWKWEEETPDGMEAKVAEKFAPVEYKAWFANTLWGGVDLAFGIAVAADVESLIVAARLKQAVPVEWAAYEAAHATLKEKAPVECTAYEAALASYASCSIESYASSVRRAHDALLDVEWHAKWAEQAAYVANMLRRESDESDESDGMDAAISTAVAALSALLQAFEAARMTHIYMEVNNEAAVDAFEVVKKTSNLVHNSLFMITLNSKNIEAIKSYREWIQWKEDADKDRQKRKASS